MNNNEINGGIATNRSPIPVPDCDISSVIGLDIEFITMYTANITTCIIM